jgi:hypothetical protein
VRCVGTTDRIGSADAWLRRLLHWRRLQIVLWDVTCGSWRNLWLERGDARFRGWLACCGRAWGGRHEIKGCETVVARRASSCILLCGCWRLQQCSGGLGGWGRECVCVSVILSLRPLFLFLFLFLFIALLFSSRLFSLLFSLSLFHLSLSLSLICLSFVLFQPQSYPRSFSFSFSFSIFPSELFNQSISRTAAKAFQSSSLPTVAAVGCVGCAAAASNEPNSPQSSVDISNQKDKEIEIRHRVCVCVCVCVCGHKWRRSRKRERKRGRGRERGNSRVIDSFVFFYRYAPHRTTNVKDAHVP